MLANAYSLKELESAPLTKNGTYRTYSYMHHPCSKWTIESLSNWIWLLKHAITMSQIRYKYLNKNHFCDDFLLWCLNNPPKLQKKGLTKFAQAMPDQYKKDDTVSAYREYYIQEKKFMKSGKKMDEYFNRERPEWMK